MGGIFSQVNAAQARGVSNYFKPDQICRVRITGCKQIVSKFKKAGNEMTIIEVAMLATTSKDPSQQPGATVCQVIDNGRGNDDPQTKMAAGDVKGFLLSQFSENDLAQIERSQLRPSEVQPNTPEMPNPYINGTKGITFYEAAQMVLHRGDDSAFKGLVADVETRNIKTKKGTDFTQIHWRPAGHFREQLGAVGLEG